MYLKLLRVKNMSMMDKKEISFGVAGPCLRSTFLLRAQSPLQHDIFCASSSKTKNLKVSTLGEGDHNRCAQTGAVK